MQEFDPDHNKYDWNNSIGELKPDIVLDYDKKWYTKKEVQYFKSII